MSGSIVLGYGALMDPAHVRELCGREHVLSFRSGILEGFRRHWNVPYRNGCHPTGRFVSRADGHPHEGGVAFLGVRPSRETRLVVSEVAVDDEGLARIDDEEYLYRRIDISTAYSPNEPGLESMPVWLYREALEEFPEGRYEGEDIVVTRSYFERVKTFAASLAHEDPTEFERTTDPCPWPVVDLLWDESARGQR